MTERYQVSAVSVEGGERVMGYLTPMWGQLHIINPDDENTAFPINPATIEPVRVKHEKHGDDYLCPNCNRVFWQPEHIPNELIGEYCDMCGQRIDWEDKS